MAERVRGRRLVGARMWAVGVLLVGAVARAQDPRGHLPEKDWDKPRAAGYWDRYSEHFWNDWYDAGEALWSERTPVQSEFVRRSREKVRESLLALIPNPEDRFGRALLDVGCGYGDHLDVFRELGFAVTALDLSAVAVQEAHARHGGAVTVFSAIAGRPLRYLMAGPERVTPFRVVTLIDLNFYVLSEERMLAILEQARAMLAADGVILVQDAMVVPAATKEPITGVPRFWSWEAMSRLLQRAGLVVMYKNEMRMHGYHTRHVYALRPGSGSAANPAWAFRPETRAEIGCLPEAAEDRAVPFGEPTSTRFTLQILAFSRWDNLRRQLDEYRRYVDTLARIVVVWNNVYEPLPAWLGAMQDERLGGVPITVVRQCVNSLNNRFRPFAAIETDAVLSMDDDILLSEHDLGRIFWRWRENPGAIVGMTERFSVLHKGIHHYTVFPTDTLESRPMVLTDCGMMHRHFYAKYWSEPMRALRDFVDRNTNCEDILINFMVQNSTHGELPARVDADNVMDEPEDLDEDDGISYSVAHRTTRTFCLQHFLKVFGTEVLGVREKVAAA